MAALIDKHGRPITDLRIAITDHCNYKCVYCRTGNDGAMYADLPCSQAWESRKFALQEENRFSAAVSLSLSASYRSCTLWTASLWTWP